MSTIIGWALVNSCIKKWQYEKAYEKIGAFQQAGVVGASARVCVGSRCLDEAHRGQGLMSALRGQLYRQIADRYDLYFASIMHSNRPSHRYHEREGYTVVGQDAEKTYFTFPVQQGATALPAASEVPAPHLVRPGRPEDGPALQELNRKWWHVNLGDDLSGGFMMTLYTEEEFAAIIAAGELAVVELLLRSDC